MHILFADDQSDIRMMVKHLIELHGRQSQHQVAVTTVDGGEAVLEILQQREDFTLVLLDHHMPPGQYGGIETLRQMTLAGFMLTTFFLSAYTSRRDINRARSVGAAGYISKSAIACDPVIECLLTSEWDHLITLADKRALWVFEENLNTFNPAR